MLFGDSTDDPVEYLMPRLGMIKKTSSLIQTRILLIEGKQADH